MINLSRIKDILIKYILIGDKYRRVSYISLINWLKLIDEVIVEDHNAMSDKAKENIAAGMEEVKASANRLIEIAVST
jgi:hypothetical protein